MAFARSVVLAIALLAPGLCAAQVHSTTPPRAGTLFVSITDENGVAVPAALATLANAQTGASLRATTDYGGHVRYFGLVAGAYNLRVEKQGFYVFEDTAIEIPATRTLQGTLVHQQEVKEVVNVTASPPAIEPAQTASTSRLDATEVLNVPYPTTRDVRNILRFIPGVVQDNNGQFHVDGAADYQNLDLLDGFNITSPVYGGLDMRFSADAVRGIDVERSRVSAQYGKLAGGVVAFTTGMGDDHFHFSATNFVPSVQNKKGWNFDKFVPRATFSGPIVPGRAWFFVAPEFEYDQDIVKELPAGADRNFVLRGSGLIKTQVNVTSRNILTASFLLDRLHSGHDGLSPFQPMPTTLNVDRSAYLADLKDQHYFHNGVLLEIALANVRFNDLQRPNGPNALIITPEGLDGNYFRALRAYSQRSQGTVNVFLPPIRRWGKHELLFGTDDDRITFSQSANRRPIFIYRENRTLQRATTFSPTAPWQRHNFEVGAYAQDRWTPVERVLVELGLRYDWDQIVRESLPAARLAATWMLTGDGKTKLSAGIGVFHDKTPLGFIAAPYDGERLDTLYEQDGVTPAGPPLATTFTVNQAALHAPRFLNSSLAVERRLPGDVYLRAEYIRKRGRNGFVFNNASGAPLGGDFVLANTRQDHFDSFQVTARKTFKQEYEVLLAYTRSSARSNQVFDFTIDNPVFSTQAAGPYAWNTPNRFLSYGWAPLPFAKNWSIAWSVDARSGFAFSAVNSNQQVVGKANAYRFPAFISIDPALEYRFVFRNRKLALRAAIENITARLNPYAVNNNIDSPEFLTFTGTGHRSFTLRIRFLGRK